MYLRSLYATLIAGPLLLAGCNPPAQTTETSQDSTASAQTQMKKTPFGILPDGREVYRYVLQNKNGVEVHVINYGGIITHLKTPDKNGVMEDIVLGYDSLDGYLKESPFFGALIGRYGNRIGKGKFKIDGQE
jgi:aldose 1-epimerase